ncbi:MAG: Hsp20/alpha crystallin family protein [Burkholderiaceae bacterium]
MNELMNFDPFSPSPIEETLRSMMRPWRMDVAERAPSMRLDIAETDKDYQIKAEIPGVNKEDIDVRIEGNQVTLSAEVRKEKQEKDDGRVLRSERAYGYASRSFTLGCPLDDAKADARYENGVLTLAIPKKAEAAGRKLSIH